MWELLQKLEKLWWKPYWKSIAELTETEKNVRLLTSRSSWLWQFVCENELTTLQIEYNNRKPPERWIRYHWNKHRNHMQEDERLSNERKRNENYEYRLIESSLKDESELEQFLLDNIKI